MVPWGSAAAVSSDKETGHAELQIPSGERRKAVTLEGSFHGVPLDFLRLTMVNIWLTMGDN